MHEYGIVQSLIRCVESEAKGHGATGVHRVTVRVGELSGVETKLLGLAFETFRERTICEGAELEIVSVPCRWSCPDCGRDLEAGAILRCPECAVPARLTQGDEIVVERIELEVADV